MRNSQSLKVSLLTIAITLLLVAAGCSDGRQSSGEHDAFAKYLTYAGVKVYGAEWCSACQYQKQLFGSSWQYVDYVECSDPSGQAEVCTQEEITSYPTWIFPDGERHSGVLSIEDLMDMSGYEPISTTAG